MPEYAANDALVGQRLKEIRLIAQNRCFLKHSMKSENCWCWRAGPAGETLPCSSACPEEDFK